MKVKGTPLGARPPARPAFTRADATGPGPHYHHIGLYAYRRAALERFVKLKPSAGEQRERLEQLRALDAGMRIDVALVKSVPSASTRRRSWRRRASCWPVDAEPGSVGATASGRPE